MQHFNPLRSLRQLILWLLLPSLLGLMVAGQWLSYRTLEAAINDAYDRVLIGSLRAIEGGVSVLDGQVNVLLPYAALEMFESVSQNPVYYRVSRAEGALLTGYPDLPGPGKALVLEKPYVFQAEFRGGEIRGVAYLKPLYQRGAPSEVMIVVAESTGARRELLVKMWRGSLWRDGIVLLAAVLTIVLGITLGLKPLDRLRREVDSRAANDLAPIAIDDVPREVRPLVEAINHHVERSASMSALQARFLADASHQLKTPLAILLAQAEYALRQPDPRKMREALEGIVAQLGQASRLTQQLLALARAQQAASTHGGGDAHCDVTPLAEEVAREYLPQARARRHDFGWEPSAVALPVTGSEMLIHEALANLIHNAIVYTPPGGHITVSATRLGDEAWLSVEDNGPGIPAEQRERVFERFVRLDGGGTPGSGLGLAIARELAQRCGGRIELANAAVGTGLRASLVLPLEFDS